MKDYKAAVFDFDLTLADSSKGILICFKHTLGAFGYSIPDDVTIFNTIGKTLVDSFDELTGIDNNPQREDMRVEYVKKADEQMAKNTFFYEGVPQGLEKLRGRGVKAGICSTKYRYRIVESFKLQTGVLPVDVIIGGEDVSAAKPDPSGLEACIAKLGVKKEDTLYVGDNVIDALAAQNAGVDFAAVLSGSTTRERFESYPHVLICEGISQLLNMLNGG